MEPSTIDAPDIANIVSTLWRVESPRLIARLGRLVGDLDTAEELAQDTFAAALERWRSAGAVPDNPAAWLTTTARHLAVDRLRRRDSYRDKYRQLAASTPLTTELDVDRILDGDLGDDLLGLIFMSCHPILSADARSALALKLLCGLTVAEVARAYLAPESTIAQRIVRAKRTLSAAKIRFELPGPAERPARLDGVREVVYLVFNEGYSATGGDQWVRRELCDEALRLGRMLASLTPDDPESLGLLALIEIQASRLGARVGPDSKPVLLLDQDRTRWDQLLIRRGLALIERIEALHGTAGPYALQAAIAACHARAGGAAAGLEILGPLMDHPALRGYHLLPAVAGDLYCAAGHHDAAREQFLRAAALTTNGPERATMQRRAAECAVHSVS